MEDEQSVREDGVADVEDTSVDDTTSENDTSSDDDSVGGETQEQDQSQQGQGTENGKEQRTEKGTRVAPDPLSAANQARANAERLAKDYETLLDDPDQLETYLSELRRERGVTKKEVAAQETEADIKEEDIKTQEDLHKFLAQERRRTENAIKELKDGVEKDRQSKQVEASVSGASREIDDAKNKYPELRQFNTDGSKNPEFNPDLEQAIGELWQEVNFDPRSGLPTGKVKLSTIISKVMAARGMGERQGSQRAKTQIVDRRSGGARNGAASKGTGKTGDESNMTASQKIAARMRNVGRTRR